MHLFQIMNVTDKSILQDYVQNVYQPLFFLILNKMI